MGEFLSENGSLSVSRGGDQHYPFSSGLELGSVGTHVEFYIDVVTYRNLCRHVHNT